MVSCIVACRQACNTTRVSYAAAAFTTVARRTGGSSKAYSLQCSSHCTALHSMGQRGVILILMFLAQRWLTPELLLMCSLREQHIHTNTQRYTRITHRNARSTAKPLSQLFCVHSACSGIAVCCMYLCCRTWFAACPLVYSFAWPQLLTCGFLLLSGQCRPQLPCHSRRLRHHSQQHLLPCHPQAWGHRYERRYYQCIQPTLQPIRLPRRFFLRV
jgi:hypothetical protein